MSDFSQENDNKRGPSQLDVTKGDTLRQKAPDLNYSTTYSKFVIKKPAPMLINYEPPKIFTLKPDTKEEKAVKRRKQ